MYLRSLILPWIALCHDLCDNSVADSILNEIVSSTALVQVNNINMQRVKRRGGHTGDHEERTDIAADLPNPVKYAKRKMQRASDWFLGEHNRGKFLTVLVITVLGGLFIFGAMLCNRRREDWATHSDDGDSVRSHSVAQTPRSAERTPRSPVEGKSPRSSPAGTNSSKQTFKVFGRDVAVDDTDWDYVLVLPLRCQTSTTFHITGAEVQLLQWDEVVDGLALARELFQDSYRNRILSDGELLQRFKQEMNREEYISAIRKLIIELLVGSHFGLLVSATPSVDGDELLLKLSLPHNNSTIQQYAANLGYKMPLSDAAYERIKSDICRDDMGTKMRAVAEFVPEHPECFQPFTTLDRLVLLRARLDKFIDLDGLLKQGAISGHFPLHNYTEVTAMCKNWANPCSWFWLPTHEVDHSVRKYFGEEVAWMYVWQSYFTKGLMIPAVVGAGVHYCRFFLSVATQHKLQFGYAIFMGLWCTWFNSYYDRKESRLQAHWGMSNFAPLTALLNRHTYDPELDKSYRAMLAPVLGDLLVLLFIGLSVVATHYIQLFRQMMVDVGAHWMWIQSAAFLISMQIIVIDKCWRYASMFVVHLENHRSETTWQESWVQKMFPVRLFINFYPFLYIGFIKQWTREGCPRIPDGCLQELETDLISYFVLRIVAELALDVAYLAWVRLQMLNEMMKKESQGHTYTYVEVQSKAMNYDKVMLMDDWTEQVLTFAFVACFNVVLPAISFIALLANLMETRLVAFRNVCYMRRPLPVAANGIGAWRQMLLLIEIVAVIINVGFAIFVMSPIKQQEPAMKCILFLGSEHVILVVKVIIKAKFPAVPQDIANIAQQQQQDVKRTFVDFEHHRVKAEVVVEQAPDVGPRALDESKSSSISPQATN